MKCEVIKRSMHVTVSHVCVHMLTSCVLWACRTFFLAYACTHASTLIIGVHTRVTDHIYTEYYAKVRAQCSVSHCGLGFHLPQSKLWSYGNLVCSRHLSRWLVSNHTKRTAGQHHTFDRFPHTIWHHCGVVGECTSCSDCISTLCYALFRAQKVKKRQ